MLTGKKVLIFDLGGVVIDLFVDRTFAAMVALGVPAEMLTEQGCLMNATMMQYDRGDVTTDEMFGYIKSFIPAAAKEASGAGLDGEVQRVWNLMLGNIAPEKLQRIDALRNAGYRVVMLSNTNSGHWPRIEQLFKELCGKSPAECFDALYLSYLMHSRKPEPGIFLSLLASEGVEPSDCLFFDDSAENCAAARALGIDAVLVERNASWDGVFK
ncbi:MAG: HAD family phosphatase [Bacteroidaceae bacterium]|nr:HAD family phosphatase [Bacteroidaceae bacterium]